VTPLLTPEQLESEIARLRKELAELRHMAGSVCGLGWSMYDAANAALGIDPSEPDEEDEA
jgi:hypothetical protein